jgi:hypothetical protein
MAEQHCTGDCLKCSFQQQVYCSAQRTYAMMNNQEAIISRLDAIESSLSAFEAKESIIKFDKEAQKDSGAEK